MSIYGAGKLLHHTDRLQRLKDGGQIAPLQVHFILSDLCQQSCKFCSYRLADYTSNQLFYVLKEDGTKNNNPNRMIPGEKAYEILGDAAAIGVKGIQFTGGGEPTLHPDHAELMNFCPKNGMEFALVSNAVGWKDATLEALELATWVRVSIDAAKESTYCAIRQVSGTHFQKMLSNVSKLVSLKRRKNLQVTIGLGFVVTKDNWTEVSAFSDLAKELGVDNIRLSAMFNPDHFEYFREIYKDASKLCKEAQARESDTFKVYNNFGSRIQDLKEEAPDYSYCGYQRVVTYIAGDQNVYRCCVTSYNQQGLLGSLKDRRFSEFWYSKDVREKLDNFDARSCELCMFHDRNKLINYFLEKNPAHVNFV